MVIHREWSGIWIQQIQLKMWALGMVRQGGKYTLFENVKYYYCRFYHFLFLGGAPTSICHFFCLSICPSVCPSITHHISGTVHHLIMIFGTHVSNDDISRCSFHFFKIMIFGCVRGGKREKNSPNWKIEITSFTRRISRRV